MISGHLHPDAVGLVLRARLPRSRGLHYARVPGQEVRERQDTDLSVHLGPPILRLHQDLGKSFCGWGCSGEALVVSTDFCWMFDCLFQLMKWKCLLRTFKCDFFSKGQFYKTLQRELWEILRRTWDKLACFHTTNWGKDIAWTSQLTEKIRELQIRKVIWNEPLVGSTVKPNAHSPLM